MIPPHLLLALITAFLYSAGSLFNKQALANGCEPLRIYTVQAWLGAILLSPYLFRGEPIPGSDWWQPVLAALFWVGGSAIFIYTLRDGDLSIVGPVAGLKPVFNAILIAVLLGTHIPPQTWIACGLAAIALIVMRTPSSPGSHSFKRTALRTLAAILLFALTDTCIQRWAPAWGTTRFTAWLFLSGAMLSLSFIPGFTRKYRALCSTAKQFLLTGAFLISLSGICIGLTIGKYGHGAEVNVGYSLHVPITLVLVWFGGRHIGNYEHAVGPRTFLRRLAGAFILLTAIFLIAR